MTRNVTITEGKPNPDSSIELWVGHTHGEWQVTLISDSADQDPNDWPIDPVEEWLLELVGDLPETIDEARNDPRMYVSDRSKQCDMDRVNLSNNPTACAAYCEDDEEWIVEMLGKEIAAKSLPHVLSDEQDQIFLYNETVMLQSDERERKPRTRQLTAFTGIGEATAGKLGDNIHRIEELLDVEAGTLTEDVRSAVSAQYHDTLREEVRDFYQKAIRSRSEDHLNQTDRKCLRGDLDWTDSLEDVYETGDAESMCLLFRDVIDPDDQFRITIDNHGEFTAQVVEIRQGEKTSVWVRIEPTSAPLESQGVIKVPAPYRNEYPVYRYERDPIDSDPITGDTIKIVRQPKITKIDRQD